MNIKEFRERAERRPRLKFSYKSYGGLSWEDWYKLAEMTKKINYMCNFDNNGNCVQSRRHKSKGYSTNKMCCCHGCTYSLGYLSYIQNDPQIIKKIAGHFKEKVGFWREGKGCILPRKYRSAVCLGYRCYDSKADDIYGKKNILIAFIDSFRTASLSDKDINILGKALIETGV